ncbi:MAG: NAD(P)H-dependent oxidoreductase [bacterium]
MVHSNWRRQLPAVLKGWVDRILRPGIAYEFEESDSGEDVPAGLLKTSIRLVFILLSRREILLLRQQSKQKLRLLLG